MAQIVLDIPDNQVARVRTALCAVGRWDPASGLTQAQFAKQFVANHIKAVVIRYESEQAKLNNDITVT
jgi:hypothetical protein